jgi:hypothetical protein
MVLNAAITAVFVAFPELLVHVGLIALTLLSRGSSKVVLRVDKLACFKLPVQFAQFLGNRMQGVHQHEALKGNHESQE